ncbi:MULTISPECIES: hypothetical protein [Methylobacterium]|uniref:Uncharacterized protein n=1 Tax=Methylobacterium bullatum TaxID=570505 RepID=A0A679IVJ2_9HYPH|nr:MULTISPECIES: hypothetical protein [Methylobacterium]GJD41981.1 hypothetical protein OICFNHDK_4472 [Methylobacterium bullatum]CAA2104680.1 hypothetical protein MBUL_02820 [Methylobacterium bullatum]
MRTDVRLRYAEIQSAPVRTLRGYDRNARTHSDSQISQIGAAIERFGFTQPLLVDEHDVVILTDGSQDVRTLIYLAHDNLLGIPNSNNALYLFVATRDEGETWFSTSVNNGAGTGPPVNVQMSSWAGMHPLFPT